MRKDIMSAVLLVPLLGLGAPDGSGQEPRSQETLTVTVLFDNFWTDDRLKTGWGFSALLETRDHTVLFDTGADGEILLENMRLLGKDPTTIEAVVISHAHGDHTGGLETLLSLGITPRLYLLESFSESLDPGLTGSVEVIPTQRGQEIVPGIRSTGEMGQAIPEQALVLDTRDGPVLLTGCAHPGVVEMARRAVELTGGPPYAVLGGFHLNQASGAEIQGVIEAFHEMGVEVAGPTHCSGLIAMTLFQDAYGERFQRMGVGRVLAFPL